MTTTQTSFSAFAATQTDPGNFAVSDQSGQRGCFFPQPQYRLLSGYQTGVNPFFDVREDFWGACDQCLDAPYYIAQGSVDSMGFGREVNGFFQCGRV